MAPCTKERRIAIGMSIAVILVITGFITLIESKDYQCQEDEPECSSKAYHYMQFAIGFQFVLAIIILVGTVSYAVD